MTAMRGARGIEAIPIHPDQIDRAGAALARGFHHDPLAAYMIADPTERARWLPAHFAASIRLGSLFGTVYSTPDEPKGAAVWFPPHGWELTPTQTKLAGVDDLVDILPAGAYDRFLSVISYLEPFHKRDVPPDHWYLALLGVDYNLQGQGVGSRLLQPILARADAERHPCYLETVEPRNLSFYRRHGFEVIVEDVEPTSSLRFWTMRRTSW